MVAVPTECDPRNTIVTLIEVVDEIIARLESSSNPESLILDKWRNFAQKVRDGGKSLPSMPDQLAISTPNDFSHLDQAIRRQNSRKATLEYFSERKKAEINPSPPSSTSGYDSGSKKEEASPSPPSSTSEYEIEKNVDFLMVDWIRNEQAFHVPLTNEPVGSRIEGKLLTTFKPSSPAKWMGQDGSRLVVLNSKLYKRLDGQLAWYAFTEAHYEFLKESIRQAGLVLCIDSGRMAFLIPFPWLKTLLPDFNQTERENEGAYWHIIIGVSQGTLCLRRKQGSAPFEIFDFRI